MSVPLAAEVNTLMRVTWAQATHIGQVRAENQDAVISFALQLENEGSKTEFWVFAVLDGMGETGNRATAIVEQTIVEGLLDKLRDKAHDKSPLQAVNETLEDANRLVINAVPIGAVTVSVVVVANEHLNLFNSGRSNHTYLVSTEKFELLARIPSLKERLLELGMITQDEYDDRSLRGEGLYYCLGMSERLDHFKTAIIPVQPNSYLLLCSYGLWAEVSEDILHQTIVNSSDPQQACDQLVALANAAGGHDNISVIVVQFTSNP